MERSAGILLPIFSLPGRYGIGSLGAEARAFVDFLSAAGQRWWQILPIGPTGDGNSPYTTESTFAGNPLLIDLERLAAQGLLDGSDLKAAEVPAGGKIVYERLYEIREPLLRKAFQRARGSGDTAVRAFVENTPWLREYTLYRAAKIRFQGQSWYDWPDEGLRCHDPAAVERWREELREDVEFRTYVQYWFFTQWAELKEYANDAGVGIIGDMPIYVSLDSADVW